MPETQTPPQPPEAAPTPVPTPAPTRHQGTPAPETRPSPQDATPPHQTTTGPQAGQAAPAEPAHAEKTTGEPDESGDATRREPVVSLLAVTASRTIACALALAGFGAACIAGLAAQVPASQTLTRAVIALVVCYLVGTLLGGAFRVLIEEHLAAHRRRHPRPPEPPELKARTPAGSS